MGEIVKRDDLHYSTTEVDGYNKSFNFVVSCREAGKTTALLLKAYKKYLTEKKSTIILRRRIADITEVYIRDLGTVISKFYGDIELYFKKGAIRDGIVDVHLQEINPTTGKKVIHKEVLFRIIALSNPMSRIKSTILRNVGLMIFDEFICNTRCNEKYLEGEAFIFQEIYNTYVRECPGLKVWFLGNPYSLYSPYTSWLKVPTNRIKRGTLLTGVNWVFQAYDIKDELKEAILKKNPLYQFDDTYTKYAFGGEAINDENIIIVEKQPSGYQLKFIFKIEQKYIGYYYNQQPEAAEATSWWCSIVEWKAEYKRNVWCFDFDNLSAGTEIMNRNYKMILTGLNNAVQQRNISYKDVEACYLTQAIYPFMG